MTRWLEDERALKCTQNSLFAFQWSMVFLCTACDFYCWMEFTWSSWHHYVQTMHLLSLNTPWYCKTIVRHRISRCQGRINNCRNSWATGYGIKPRLGYPGTGWFTLIENWSTEVFGCDLVYLIDQSTNSITACDQFAPIENPGHFRTGSHWPPFYW